MNTKIIDNFLLDEDFDKLCKINLKKIKESQINVYQNQINKDGKVEISDCIEEDLLKKLHYNYHEKAINILESLNSEKVKLYDYSVFHIVQTGKNYKFPIHDDTPNKLISGVIYLYPKKNSGTIFYSNKKGDEKKNVEWIQNRAVFFSRIEKETWHSYGGDGISDRIALVYNLMTYKIKDVYKIEKKNYYIGSLRWKINPYLYNLFKISI